MWVTRAHPIIKPGGRKRTKCINFATIQWLPHEEKDPSPPRKERYLYYVNSKWGGGEEGVPKNKTKWREVAWLRWWEWGPKPELEQISFKYGPSLRSGDKTDSCMVLGSNIIHVYPREVEWVLGLVAFNPPRGEMVKCLSWEGCIKAWVTTSHKKSESLTPLHLKSSFHNGETADVLQNPLTLKSVRESGQFWVGCTLQVRAYVHPNCAMG